MTEEKVVWMVETGEYEQRYVKGIFSSLEIACAAIKRPYTVPPYAVAWEGPRKERDGSYTLLGNFTAVKGYCGNVQTEWTITPVVMDAED